MLVYNMPWKVYRYIDYVSLFQYLQDTFIATLITSLAKEVMFLVALVCLFVCLWTTLLKMLGTDWDEILWRSPG